MKKIFSLLALLVLMGCDDGEMTFNTFNFGTASVQSCSNDAGLLYKINGTQALVLDLDPLALVNTPTTNGPRIVTLNGSNRLIYRNYSGSVAAASICSSLPPATPTVLEEWLAQPGGTISITTTPVENDEGVVTGYSHAITLAAITLVNGDQTTIINETEFGTYSSPLGYSFDFLDEEENIELNVCPDNDLIFRVNGSEALIFNVNPALFPSAPTTTPVLQDVVGNANISEIIFNKYTGSASTTLFCDETPPITPTVQKQWFAVLGQVQIETITDPAGLRHIISLVNVYFQNNQGETFIVGATEPYRIGTYNTD